MNNRLINHHSLYSDIAVLLLRLVFGGMFIYFGYQKIINRELYLGFFVDPIGWGKTFSYDLVTYTELVCGIFIAAGLFTRLFVIPVFIAMIVAFFIAHKNDPFEKSQYAFVYMILCLPVFLLGSGKYSADRIIFRNK